MVEGARRDWSEVRESENVRMGVSAGSGCIAGVSQCQEDGDSLSVKAGGVSW